MKRSTKNFSKSVRRFLDRINFNIVGGVLCVIVAGILGYLVYTTNKEENAKAAYLYYLNEQTKKDEAELQELKEELQNFPESAGYVSESSKFVVGFLVSDADDLVYVEDKADLYGFQPVIVLDCTMEMEQIEAIVGAMDAEEMDESDTEEPSNISATRVPPEIMLYAPDFSEATNENVLSVISYLDSVNREYSSVFFIRTDDYNTSNIRLLKNEGFVGYTSYNEETPESGQAADDTVYVDYAYLTSSRTSVLDRLLDSYYYNVSTIVIFDINSIESGNLPETYVISVLNTLYDYTFEDNCSFSTLKEVVGKLSQINSIEADIKAEHDKEKEKLQTQVNELQKTIDEMYSGF